MATRVLPTQDASLGSIKGSLFASAPEAGKKPTDGVVLYLGSILRNADGREELVSLDRIAAPRADVISDGSFVFVNVPPGRYGLIADIDIQLILLNKPGDGSEFIIEVEAGKQTDVGELVYTDLPPLK